MCTGLHRATGARDGVVFGHVRLGNFVSPENQRLNVRNAKSQIVERPTCKPQKQVSKVVQDFGRFKSQFPKWSGQDPRVVHNVQKCHGVGKLFGKNRPKRFSNPTFALETSPSVSPVTRHISRNGKRNTLCAMFGDLQTAFDVDSNRRDAIRTQVRALERVVRVAHSHLLDVHGEVTKG